MRFPTISPRTYRRITLVALGLLGLIIITGGAVRLTGSGLGCTNWPTCEKGQVVAPLQYHAMIEFGNRLVTGAVSVVVIVAVLGSLARRPRRRDLVWLSLGLVAGVLGQIVLGGLTVLFDLAPPLVMAHFGLSMAILACAVVLHHRAGRPDDGRPVPLAPPPIAPMGGLLVAATALVVLLGTVVTGAGPHPGSNGDQVVARLQFNLHDVARLHGVAVMILLALVVTTVAALVQARAPRAVLRRAEGLLAVLVAQAAVGYTQYFLGVPALLVGVHIAGATAVWASVLWFRLGLVEWVPAAPVAVGGAAERSPAQVLAPT